MTDNEARIIVTGIGGIYAAAIPESIGCPVLVFGILTCCKIFWMLPIREQTKSRPAGRLSTHRLTAAEDGPCAQVEYTLNHRLPDRLTPPNRTNEAPAPGMAIR